MRLLDKYTAIAQLLGDVLGLPLMPWTLGEPVGKAAAKLRVLGRRLMAGLPAPAVSSGHGVAGARRCLFGRAEDDRVCVYYSPSPPACSIVPPDHLEPREAGEVPPVIPFHTDGVL